jgi:hypothetical protein
MKSKSLAAALSAAGLFCVVSSAEAAPLSVTDVAAPAIHCVFNTTCTVPMTDTTGTFAVPGDVGDAKLITRTYPGTAPAPGAGTMAYVYLMNLTDMQHGSTDNCVTKVVIHFGPVVPLPYHPAHNYDVFVVSSGAGIGTIGLSSADEASDDIVYTFVKPVCPNNSSYFFGQASQTLKPTSGTAEVFFSLGGSKLVPIRHP